MRFDNVDYKFAKTIDRMLDDDVPRKWNREECWARSFSNWNRSALKWKQVQLK
jgi:hypothetical protein